VSSSPPPRIDDAENEDYAADKGKKTTRAKPTTKLHEIGTRGHTTTSWILLVVIVLANFSCSPAHRHRLHNLKQC
jgi:hypothetical protein